MTTFYYCSLIFTNSVLLLAFIYGVSNKQLRRNQETKWYINYLGFILGIEIITKVIIFIFHSNNTQLVYPLYITGEFYILSQLFLRALKASKKWHTVTIVVSSCIFIEGMALWHFNNDASTGFGKTCSHLTIICLAAYLLIKGIKELERTKPILIVYAALFLYYSVSLFLFLLMNQLTKGTIVIWSVNNLLSTMLYGSSIYTFYQLKKL